MGCQLYTKILFFEIFQFKQQHYFWLVKQTSLAGQKVYYHFQEIWDK